MKLTSIDIDFTKSKDSEVVRKIKHKFNIGDIIEMKFDNIPLFTRKLKICGFEFDILCLKYEIEWVDNGTKDIVKEEILIKNMVVKEL